jgi:hypothetical protein
VQVDFATVRRWSSHSTISWSGNTWTAIGLRMEDLAVGVLAVGGTLAMSNADNTIGTLVLAEGVKDRAITIYGYDAAEPTAVVWLASAVGARAMVAPREVRIDLRHRAEYTASPRTFVDAAAGFTQMLPSGTVMRINGVDVRLDRRS